MMKRVFKIIMAIVWILLIGFTVSSAEEATPDNKSTEERIAVKISVLTTPTRTEYTAFDRFDADGLSVQVEYSTGECEVLERDLLTVEYLTDSECLRWGDGGVYISYADMRLLLPLDVKKREYDLSAVSFSSVRCTYSGEWQRIELSHELPVGLDGLPLLASISGAGRDVGVYNISLTFSGESRDYLIPEPQNARLEILPYRMEVEWLDTEFVYDGSSKIPRAFALDEKGERIELDVYGEGVYASDSYVAHATAPSDNYVISGAFTSYKIKKADYDMSGVRWSESEFVYDGEEKTVSLNGLPAGITLQGYSGNSANNAGSYRAEPILSYDVRNYNAPKISALEWEIKKADYDVSGVKWVGLDAIYDGLEHRAELIGLPDGISVSEYVGGVATLAGSYPVRAVLSFDEQNYNQPNIQGAMLNVAKRTVPVPTTKTIIYNGEAQKIDFSAGEYYQKTNITVKSIGSYTVQLVICDPDNFAFTHGGSIAHVEVLCRLSDRARLAIILSASFFGVILVIAVTILILRRERLLRIVSALRCRATLAEEHFLPSSSTAEPVILLSETAMSSVDRDRADSLLSDAMAKSLIALAEEPIYTEGRRKCIVNIDTLSENFEAGERVDVNILKERGLVPSDTAYIKILARGIIDKPLTVCANDFTPAAVKMIALTGGEARRVITLHKKNKKS